MSTLARLLVAGVTEKHFKEKLPRVLGLGLGNAAPDAATMSSGVRGLMFGDYMGPGPPSDHHLPSTVQSHHNCMQATGTVVLSILYEGNAPFVGFIVL